MLKTAYRVGVLKALEEAGLSKEAQVMTLPAEAASALLHAGGGAGLGALLGGIFGEEGGAGRGALIGGGAGLGAGVLKALLPRLARGSMKTLKSHEMIPGLRDPLALDISFGESAKKLQDAMQHTQALGGAGTLAGGIAGGVGTAKALRE